MVLYGLTFEVKSIFAFLDSDVALEQFLPEEHTEKFLCAIAWHIFKYFVVIVCKTNSRSEDYSISLNGNAVCMYVCMFTP